MSIVKLNTLPCPTFTWLGVNDTTADAAAPVSESVSPGGTVQISESAAFEVSAQGGEKRSAVMFISPTESAHITTKVTAQGGSHVTLVQVFDGSERTVSKVEAAIGDDAGFELVQLYLKTADTISEVDVHLDGTRAQLDTSIGYLLGGSDRLDINLIARHFGRKTRSQITAKGVMQGSAEKTFKGTIDFVNGCSGALGEENEDALLIGEKVVNKTVPLILCAEENVEGSHGASIGRVDEEHIFYMLSRGLPEDEIIRLMARSKIAQIVGRIADEQVRGRINEIITRGTDNE